MRGWRVPGGFTATLCAGAILLAAAALFDAEALYVPGIALVVLALGACAWVLTGTLGTTAEPLLERRGACGEEPVEVTVLARPGVTILPGTALADPLLNEPLLLRPAAGIHRVRIEVRFSRRGRRVLPPPALEVSDPFSLVRGRVDGRGDDQVLLILPRIEPVIAATTGGDAAHLGRRRATVAAAETEIDGLRPHRQGAPASRIFWPALARGGELLERRMRPEADARPLIALDTSGATSEEDVDAAVRATASLAIHLSRQGGCALLLPGDRRPTLLDPPLQGWAQLHVRLALRGGGETPSAGALAVRRGPLIWVSARRAERMPRALSQAGAMGRTLVVPGRLASRR